MFEAFVVALQFLSGSVMYAYVLARIAGVDLRKVRDGNPGSSNLWRAKGAKWGIAALALDYFKGTFPLFLFVSLGKVTNGYVIALAALSGVAGHAFSPMLRFKGGKAIATTFGAWSVLTKWEAPVILGAVFTLFSIFKKKTSVEEDAFRVLLGVLFLLPYVLYRTVQGNSHILLFYVGNAAILSLKHWRDWRGYFSRRVGWGGRC